MKFLILKPETAHKLIGWVYLALGIFWISANILKSFTLLQLIRSSSWYILSYTVECLLSLIFVFSVIHFFKKKLWARLVCELYSWLYAIYFPIIMSYTMYHFLNPDMSSVELFVTLIPVIPLLMFELFQIFLLLNIRSKQLRDYFIEPNSVVSTLN